MNTPWIQEYWVYWYRSTVCTRIWVLGVLVSLIQMGHVSVTLSTRSWQLWWPFQLTADNFFNTTRLGNLLQRQHTPPVNCWGSRVYDESHIVRQGKRYVHGGEWKSRVSLNSQMSSLIWILGGKWAMVWSASNWAFKSRLILLLEAQFDIFSRI